MCNNQRVFELWHHKELHLVRRAKDHQLFISCLIFLQENIWLVSVLKTSVLPNGNPSCKRPSSRYFLLPIFIRCDFTATELQIGEVLGSSSSEPGRCSLNIVSDVLSANYQNTPRESASLYIPLTSRMRYLYSYSIVSGSLTMCTFTTPEPLGPSTYRKFVSTIPEPRGW